MKPILFSLTLVFTTLACFAQDYYGNNRKQWLQKAEQYKPKLIITEKKPLKVVDSYLVTTSPQSPVLPSAASSLRLDYRLRVPPALMV